MAPTIEFVQQQTQRIGESMTAIEARREFVEDLHRRMADLDALSGRLDERGLAARRRAWRRPSSASWRSRRTPRRPSA